MASLALDLLSAPASIGLAHVAGGFDGGDELEGNVGNANDANGATGDLAHNQLAEKEATDEDVDYMVSEERAVSMDCDTTYRIHGRQRRREKRRIGTPEGGSGTLRTVSRLLTVASM